MTTVQTDSDTMVIVDGVTHYGCWRSNECGIYWEDDETGDVRQKLEQQRSQELEQRRSRASRYGELPYANELAELAKQYEEVVGPWAGCNLTMQEFDRASYFEVSVKLYNLINTGRIKPYLELYQKLHAIKTQASALEDVDNETEIMWSLLHLSDMLFVRKRTA